MLLAIDTTTRSCSVALVQDDLVLAEYTLNIPKTHSQRLMPLVDRVLKDAGAAPSELQAVAVAAGPGSFTGIRIGVATARGLAQGLSIPAVGVNTLEAMADGVLSSGLICPILDARRRQVYAALYRRDRQGWARAVHPPAALSLDSLVALLGGYSDPVCFLGDGLGAYGEDLEQILGSRFYTAAFPLAFNRASLVARRALRQLREEGPRPLTELTPGYLRAPEAERRLAEKKGKN